MYGELLLWLLQHCNVVAMSLLPYMLFLCLLPVAFAPCHSVISNIVACALVAVFLVSVVNAVAVGILALHYSSVVCIPKQSCCHSTDLALYSCTVAQSL